MNNLDELLSGRHGFDDLLTQRFFFNSLNKRARNGKADVGIEQGQTDGRDRIGDVTLRKAFSCRLNRKRDL